MDYHTQSRFESFNGMETAVARFDPTGVLTYVNEEGLRLLGIRSGEHVDLEMLLPDVDELKRVQGKLAERVRGKSEIYQVTIQRPHDSDVKNRIPVSVCAVPDASPNGEVTGSIAVFRDLRLENARSGIHHAVEVSRTNEALFSRIVEHLRTVFTFDEFRVTAVSQSRRHLRRLYSSDPQASTKYPFRWWPMPPFILEKLDKYVPEIMDVDEMRRDPDYQDLIRRDISCKTFFESGVRQILSLPIMRGKRIIAFVSLDSKTEDRYSTSTLEQFMSLPIAEAVYSARLREQRQRQQSVLKLIRKMTKSSIDIGTVAEELVQFLRRTFGWEHISLFQVESRKFRLMAQANDPAHMRLPEYHELPRPACKALDIAVDSVKPFVVDENRDSGVFGPGNGSVLALPVSSEGLQWVLLAESSSTHAFAIEEIELLKLLAAEAGSVMARAAMFGLKEAVLKSIGDAVFEVDSTGNIRTANFAAERLLGVKTEDLQGQSVFSFFHDKDVCKDWQDRSEPASAELQMRRAGGRTVSVLLSVSSLPPQFGGQVYVATDLTPHKEVQRLSEMKTIFQRGAMEGRVPLSLAASTLQLEAMESNDTRDLKSVLDKVQRYLARADLPLERLMRLFAAEHKLLSNPYSDILRAVQTTTEELPRAMLERLRLELPRTPIAVTAAFDDLQFCIESLISFGIRTMPQSELLDVRLATKGQKACLSVLGSWTPAIDSEGGSSEIDRWRRKSLGDLMLGHSIIERIASKFGGNFECDLEQQCKMIIEFPLFHK